MKNKVVLKFLDDKKEAWLKRNIKKSMTYFELSLKNVECEQKFNPKNWIPKAGSRAKNLDFATHPCTFTHPLARNNRNGHSSPIVARNVYRNDGFLRYGNAGDVEIDIIGNASAVEIYKFLNLVMEDGERLLDHIEKETEIGRDILSQEGSDYKVLRNEFLQMDKALNEVVTSSKIKQVYFFNRGRNEYHLLSILTCSGMVFKLRKLIDEMLYSVKNKHAGECYRKRGYSKSSYREIPDLTVISYGGSQPQNTSALNSKNVGRAYLLLSSPPPIYNPNITLPVTGFFRETFTPWSCKHLFYEFHDLIIKGYWQNIDKTELIINEYLETIIHIVWQLRVFLDDYKADLSDLKKEERIWLLPSFKEERLESDNWLNFIVKEIVNEFIKAYETVNYSAFKLGVSERFYILSVVEKIKEELR